MKKLFLALIFVLCFGLVTTHAQQEVEFIDKIAPKSWPTQAMGDYRLYQLKKGTAPGEDITLAVRGLAATKTALQWAGDEAATHEQMGAKIVMAPQEVTVGKAKWAKMISVPPYDPQMAAVISEAQFKGLDVQIEIYFVSKGMVSIFEVALSGPKKELDSFDRTEVNNFLSQLGEHQ